MHDMCVYVPIYMLNHLAAFNVSFIDHGDPNGLASQRNSFNFLCEYVVVVVVHVMVVVNMYP
jgi:hypothetical protein